MKQLGKLIRFEGGIVATSIVVGAATLSVWLGFNAGLESTNQTEFCISCHSMENTVYQEYKESGHYKNVSGVRAGCADCHVPKSFLPKMKRKILAANDVYHEVLGTIDSKEKFESRRLHLAERVWARMRARDSAECKSCHSFNTMALDDQDKSASKKHKKAIDKNKTCIDCHQGVVHELPKDWSPEKDKESDT